MTRQQSDAIALIGRLLMSAIFLMSGFHKLMAPSDTIGHIAADGLPVPPVAYVVAVLCEFGGGLALLLGWQTRLAAAALALFCLFTAATVHYQPGNPGQMINFWKNVTMAGGYLYVLAFGGGAFSLDAWRRSHRGAPQPA
jgi:putative oxidoreductase